MESIKPQDIKRGMVIVDECNETAYTVLEDARKDRSDPIEATFYVRTLSLTNWGSLIEKNYTYLPGDGELYVVSRPAPFALPK